MNNNLKHLGLTIISLFAVIGCIKFLKQNAYDEGWFRGYNDASREIPNEKTKE